MSIFDTSGNSQPGFGFTNTGPFDNLLLSVYWSGTEYSDSPDGAWVFFTLAAVGAGVVLSGVGAVAGEPARATAPEAVPAA